MPPGLWKGLIRSVGTKAAALDWTVYQSVLTAETEFMQDRQIHKDLRWLPTESGAEEHEGSACALGARRTQAKDRCSLQCPTPVYIRRPNGLQYKAGEAVLEAGQRWPKWR